MNKFEQVSSDHHQMSLAGVPRSDVQGGSGGPQIWCPGRFPTSPFGGEEEEVGYPTMWPYPMMHLMLSLLWTDRCLWKHYLPTNLFAGGNKSVPHLQWITWEISFGQMSCWCNESKVTFVRTMFTSNNRNILTYVLQPASVILSVCGRSNATGERVSVSVFRLSRATSASDVPAFMESFRTVNRVENAMKAGNAVWES